jgi:hypothetical protein
MDETARRQLLGERHKLGIRDSAPQDLGQQE